MMSVMIKMLKNLLFTIILLVGCSLAAFGQSNDQTPPKEKPPVVPIKPKETPKPTPKPTPKKPESEISVSLQGGAAVLG